MQSALACATEQFPRLPSAFDKTAERYTQDVIDNDWNLFISEPFAFGILTRMLCDEAKIIECVDCAKLLDRFEKKYPTSCPIL